MDKRTNSFLTINVIIKKLEEINRRVIDHLISSRSVYSFDFGRTVDHGTTIDGKILVKNSAIRND